MVSDRIIDYLNVRTGEFVAVGDEELEMAAAHENSTEYPDWQREMIRQAAEILESEDYIELPSRFDINEWEVMRNFCSFVRDSDTREDLLDAVHGSGAFRRFNNVIRRRGIEDSWYRFRDLALADIAVEWLEENNLAYIRDVHIGGDGT